MRALFALFGLSACQLATQSADTAAPDPAEAAAWRGNLLGGVQAADRAFTPAGPGRFAARHLGWGYALQVDEAGLHVGHGAAELSLRFSGWGRAEHTEAVPLVAPEIGGCAEDGERLPDGGCAPELAYVYPGGVTAWIDNTAAGPRQRWTLEERPEGEGLLALEVEVSGADLSTDGALVLLRDAHGVQHQYHGLAAWDAEGVPLPAHFVVEEGLIRVLVDDTDAVWPSRSTPPSTPPPI